MAQILYKCVQETVDVDEGGLAVRETRLNSCVYRLGSPMRFLTDSQPVTLISLIMIIMLSRRMHACASGG